MTAQMCGSPLGPPHPPVLDGVTAKSSIRRTLLMQFPDDANLIALSAERMNYLLALLAVFCDAFGMFSTISDMKQDFLRAIPI